MIPSDYPVGIHANMEASVYHSLSGASASRLMKLWRSTPAHLRLQLDEPFEPTPAMMIGTLGHSLLLEPDKELPHLAVMPETYPAEDGPKKWNANSTWCKDWLKLKRAEGMLPLSRTDYDNAHAAAKALADHELIRPVLANCDTELTLVTWDSVNEVGVRCRFDVKPAAGCPNLVDCKFTGMLDADSWPTHAYNSGYHIQAALNLHVWNQCAGADDPKTGFEFWAVENKPPFDVVVFECDPDFIAEGWREVCRLLPIYAECERTGVWHGSPARKVACGLPRWVKRD